MGGLFGVEKCPFCGSDKFVFQKTTGEVVCRVCGYVAKVSNVDFGPEWRSFEGDEVDRSRAGPPQTALMADRGLGSVLGTYGYGGFEKGKMSESRRRDLQRVKTWISRTSSVSSHDRNLQNALNTLQKLGEKLFVPKQVLERAAEIYRQALAKDLVRGRAINSIVAASLYLALREMGTPRTQKQMAKVANIDKKELGRCYRLLIKTLNIKPPVIDPIAYVHAIALEAGYPQQVTVYAEKIIKLAKKMKITAGKDPVGLAAAAVYYAALINGQKVTQRDIANAADITEVTVRNRCKSLLQDFGVKSVDELKRLVDQYIKEEEAKAQAT